METLFEVFVLYAQGDQLVHFTVPGQSTANALFSKVSKICRVPLNDAILLFCKPTVASAITQGDEALVEEVLDPRHEINKSPGLVHINYKHRRNPLEAFGLKPCVQSAAPDAKLEATSVTLEDFQNCNDANLLFVFSRAQIQRHENTVTPSVTQQLNPAKDKLDVIGLSTSISEEVDKIVQTSGCTVKAEHIKELVQFVLDARTHRDSALSKSKRVNNLFRKCQLKRSAILAVRVNLIGYVNKLNEREQAFQEQCAKADKETSQVLEGIEDAVAAFSTVPLPESIAKAVRYSGKRPFTLSQLLNVDTALFDDCQGLNNAIQAKAKTLITKDTPLETFDLEVDNELLVKAQRVHKLQEGLLMHLEQRLNEINSTTQASDIDTWNTEFKELAKQNTTYNNEVSLVVSEAEQMFSHGYKKLQECLSQTAQKQSQIGVHISKLSGLNPSFDRLKSLQEQICNLRELPKTIERSLEEVVRRRNFKKTYTEQIQSLSETVGKMRDKEVQARDTFATTVGKKLPAGIIPGLLEASVPICDITGPSFDTKLPMVSDAELNELFPLRQEKPNTKVTPELSLQEKVDLLEVENKKLKDQLEELRQRNTS